MRRTRKLITALLIALCAVPAVASAEGPAERHAYGTPWGADGLANLPIGRYSDTDDVDYRFRADATGQVAAVRVFFIWSTTKTGYQTGTGGDIKILLQTDAGGVPSGTTLAAGTDTAPMEAGTGDRIAYYHKVWFTSNATVTKGTVYHLRFHNVNRSQGWISTDELWLAAGGARSPIMPDNDLAALYRSGSSWATAGKHIPVFTLFHADGTAHGPGTPYVYVPSQTAARTVSGTNRVAELMVPTVNQTVTGAAFRVRYNSGGALTLRLKNAVGSDMRTCSGTVSGTGWVRCTFPSSYTMTAGATYRLVASTSGSYTTWPLQGHSGFASPWQFADGYSQYTTDNGATWLTASGTAYDFQAYLTTAG